MHFLALAARHGRLVLILGLVAGVALPDVAIAMRPWIAEMVAALLFLAALRIGPRQALGAVKDVGTAILSAGVFQLLLPLAVVAGFALSGLLGSVVATFFILMLAAPPISGSPNLTLMTGNDPAPALRQLVVGTALLPLTVVPVFWLTPQFGEAAAVLGAALRLMLLIAGAAAVAFAIRATILREPSRPAIEAIDGVAAIAMAVVVIGLMSAVGPALRAAPAQLAGTIALVCAVNFALQLSTWMLFRGAGQAALSAPAGIVAANRNIALFLTVLPAATVEPLLLLIGCYQIPMYLTPAVFSRLYGSPAR